jgi:hypothetical protein
MPRPALRRTAFVPATRTRVAALGTFATLAAGCSREAPKEPLAAAQEVPVTSLPGHESLAEDTSRKAEPRLLTQEALVRSYMAIFGDLSPMTMQARLRTGSATLFDTWSDYLGALGLPNYETDTPRTGQTNALMLAAFERIGVALCDKAAEADLGRAARPLAQRTVFRFELPAAPLPEAEFRTRFDLLHRTFLSYPVALAAPDRVANFYALYTSTLARHTQPDAGAFTATPQQAAWASVCYGLVRHPEFHLY